MYAKKGRRVWFVAALGAAVLFSLIPQIDIATSKLFFSDGGFPVADMPIAQAISKGIAALVICLGLVSLVSGVVAAARGRLFGIPSRHWNFVVAIYILGPGLMANLLLKRFWGRARPEDIAEFGGAAEFTPALWPTNQCETNCSFVSAETSGATAFALSVYVLSAKIEPRWLRAAIRAGAIAVIPIVALIRVSFGRHFLSDVVFATLFVTGIALVLYRYRSVLSKSAN